MSHEARVGAKTQRGNKIPLDSDRLGFKSSFPSCVIWASYLTLLQLSVLSKEAQQEHPLQEAVVMLQ